MDKSTEFLVSCFLFLNSPYYALLFAAAVATHMANIYKNYYQF